MFSRIMHFYSRNINTNPICNIGTKASCGTSCFDKFDKFVINMLDKLYCQSTCNEQCFHE